MSRCAPARRGGAWLVLAALSTPCGGVEAGGLVAPPAAAAVAVPVPAPVLDQAATRLLQRVLDRTRRIESFTARFEQRLEPRGLPAPPVESGRLFYRRPDRMRWEYEFPERKLAVSDGRTGWLELPDERRVLSMDLDDGAKDGSIETLLSGRAGAVDEFTVVPLAASRGADGGGSPLSRLRLTPLKRARTFDSVELGFDPATLIVREIAVIDPGGNRMTYTFINLKEGTAGGEALYRYVPPPGFEVSAP